MTAARITKLLKRGKKADALNELIQLIRTNYEDASLLNVFMDVAQSMNNSISSRDHVLLCAFVDQLLREERLSDAVPLASFIFRHLNHLPEPNRLMAIICEKLGDGKKAETYLLRLCQLQPDRPQNYSFLGRIKRANRDLQGALDCFNKALRMDDKNESLLSELGIFLFDVAQYQNAADIYYKLYDLYPNNQMAAANLIVSLMAQGKIDEGFEIIKKADSHLANNGFYLDAKAKILLEAAKVDEALFCAEKAVRLNPKKDTFKATLSHVYLAAGRLREGFENYKHRFSKEMVGGVIMDDVNLPTLSKRSEINGKHIFVRSEQGFGDTLNFCRLISLIQAEGGTVTFAVQPPLISLMQDTFPDVTIVDHKAEPEHSDYQCPLLDIAAIFRIGLEDLPILENYITADKAYLKKWSSVLGQKKKFRVGLTWSGGTATRHDKRRTIELEKFLSSLPEGPEYISLQKEVRDYDKATLAANPQIRHFGEQLEDFRDTAALVDLVDLVVCVDTSIVHLTGAMGKEAWLLVPFKPDFRWLYDREDSPWYPSLRLIRQTTHGTWEDELQRIHDGLTERLSQSQLKTAS